jgi:putative membrane protein
MHRSARSAVCLTAAALLIAACSSADDKPYAHESQRHTTAAEQSYGTTGGDLATTPPSSPMLAEQPTVTTAPAAPLTVPQPVARVAPTDAAFSEKLAASNAAEIELSRIAYVRARSPEVRSFARQLLIDHRDMAIKLDNFALERGHLVVWQIEPEMASTIERLRPLDGAAFDQAYMETMVEAHSKAVATLETQGASGRETASLANSFVPTVRHHLEMARELDAKL